jgi:hypothetical protein
VKTVLLIAGTAGIAAYTWDQIIEPRLASAGPNNPLGGLAVSAPCFLCWLPFSDDYILWGALVLLAFAIFAL